MQGNQPRKRESPRVAMPGRRRADGSGVAARAGGSGRLQPAPAWADDDPVWTIVGAVRGVRSGRGGRRAVVAEELVEVVSFTLVPGGQPTQARRVGPIGAEP